MNNDTSLFGHQQLTLHEYAKITPPVAIYFFAVIKL